MDFSLSAAWLHITHNVIDFSQATEAQIAVYRREYILYLENGIRNNQIKFSAGLHDGNIIFPTPYYTDFYSTYRFYLKNVPNNFFVDIAKQTIKTPFALLNGYLYIANSNM